MNNYKVKFIGNFLFYCIFIFFIIMIDDEKKFLRKKIRLKKEQFSFEEKKRKSEIIFSEVEKLDSFKKSEVIMLYWSMDDEVNTHDFVKKWSQKKQIILPSVNGDNLELKIFKGLNKLVSGQRYNILEPEGELFTQTDRIDVIFVPGVAFDENNNRMGRGKAYYDKLLLKTICIKIGLCFDFQFLDIIPTDKFDVKMDMVIHD